MKRNCIKSKRVCPVKGAKSFDTFLRKWFQNPYKILSPFVKEGMTVIDYGCGPGFFTVEIARLVGESGRVFAVDIQEGMLELLKAKIENFEFKNRILPYKCNEKGIGISEPVDFVLAFYVVHEVPCQNALFNELNTILNPGGQILMAEPPLHVWQSEYLESLTIAQDNGFKFKKGPSLIFNKTAILERV